MPRPQPRPYGSRRMHDCGSLGHDSPAPWRNLGSHEAVVCQDIRQISPSLAARPAHPNYCLKRIRPSVGQRLPYLSRAPADPAEPGAVQHESGRRHLDFLGQQRSGERDQLVSFNYHVSIHEKARKPGRCRFGGADRGSLVGERQRDRMQTRITPARKHLGRAIVAAVQREPHLRIERKPGQEDSNESWQLTCFVVDGYDHTEHAGGPLHDSVEHAGIVLQRPTVDSIDAA